MTPFRSLMAEWCIHLAAEGRRPATISTYTRDVGELARWAEMERDIDDPCLIDRHTLDTFFVYLRDRGLSGTTSIGTSSWRGRLMVPIGLASM